MSMIEDINRTFANLANARAAEIAARDAMRAAHAAIRSDAERRQGPAAPDLIAAAKTAGAVFDNTRSVERFAEIAHAVAVERLRLALERAAYKTAADVLPAFAGKAAGEKTRAKACAAIVAAAAAAVGIDPAGLAAWFSGYYKEYLEFRAYSGPLANCRVTVYAGNGRFIDDENKLQVPALTPPEPETDTRTPEQFAAAFVVAQSEIEELLAETEKRAQDLRASATCGYVRPGYVHITQDVYSLRA